MLRLLTYACLHDAVHRFLRAGDDFVHVSEPDFVQLVRERHVSRDAVLRDCREADAFLRLPVPEAAGLDERGVVAVVFNASA